MLLTVRPVSEHIFVVTLGAILLLQRYDDGIPLMSLPRLGAETRKFRE
jgi:hypothetical protein